MVNIIVKDRDTRKADRELLERGGRSSDPNVRRQVAAAYENMKHETGKIESMREALIKAHREGNKEEIRDIHDYVEHHREYDTRHR